MVNKKIQIVVLALIILGTVAACDWGKSTTIVNKTDNLSQRIKYSGKVVFNEKQDGIEKISDTDTWSLTRTGGASKLKKATMAKLSTSLIVIVK
jgi:hypothetical protein